MTVEKFTKLIITFLFVLNVGNLYSNNIHNIHNISSINIPKNEIFYSKYNNTINVYYKNKIYIYDECGIKNIIKNKDIKNKKICNIISNEHALIVQTKNDELISIDKTNNKTKWIKSINGKLFFTPLLSKNKLFIDYNGEMIIALNNINGDFLWKYKVEMRNFFIYTNGKVLQTAKHLFYIYPDKKVVILKKKNGEKVDSHVISLEKKDEINKKRKLLFITDINIYNNIIYICYDDGNFLAIDGISGKFLWKKNKKNYKHANIYKNNILIIKKNGHITYLNKFNGKKIWTNNNFKNKNFMKPSVLNKNVIIIFDERGIAYILKRDTGHLIRSLETRVKEIKHLYKINSKNIILISKGKMSKLTFK